MKIDLVTPTLNVGGSEKQLTGLAVGLRDAGHDVTVIKFRSGGALEHELVAKGVPVMSLGPPLVSASTKIRVSEWIRAVVEIWRLGRYWLKNRPDAMQAWLPEAQIISLPVAAVLQVPTRIMSVRSMSASVRLTPVKRRLIGIAARCSTLVTANSQAALEDPGWPIFDRPCRVIYNGVSKPLRRSRPAEEPARGIVIANLTPIKGHRVLLEALSCMVEPPYFTFVGSGPEQNELTRLIWEYGLEKKVTIVSGVHDPGDVLTNAQFLVLPSPSEGSPNAILEAMAAGLPAVAFRVGGIPELIEDGETGLLVNPGDSRGLARAIEKVVGDTSWRAAAGSKAADRARSFGWDAVINANLEAMGETPFTYSQ